jgi:hypothetical protein
MIDSFKLLFAIVFVFISGELQADQQIWQPIAVQAHGDDPNTGIFIADKTIQAFSLQIKRHCGPRWTRPHMKFRRTVLT